MPELDIAGRPVWYRDTGAGESVVALHSSASSGKQWQDLGTLLAGDFRVLAPDLYGYGKAADWSGPAPLQLADDVAIVAAMAALGEGAIHLVGHSYGGVVALRAVMDGRVPVRSLTLFEPVAFYLLRDGTAADQPLWREASRVAGAVRIAVEQNAPAVGMAHFVDYWNGAGSWPEMKQKRRQSLTRRAAKVASDFVVIFAETTRLARYGEIAIPTLVLRGERTKPPTRRIADKLAATLPDAAYVAIPAVGHMAPVSDPEPVNARIAEHLYRHGLTGQAVLSPV